MSIPTTSIPARAIARLIRPVPPAESKSLEQRAGIDREDPLPAEPIDLAATDEATRTLDRWPRMTWEEKRKATHVIDKAFGLAGTEYVEYGEGNRELILEHLESRARLERSRRAADSAQPNL